MSGRVPLRPPALRVVADTRAQAEAQFNRYWDDVTQLAISNLIIAHAAGEIDDLEAAIDAAVTYQRDTADAERTRFLQAWDAVMLPSILH